MNKTEFFEEKIKILSRSHLPLRILFVSTVFGGVEPKI
jgi:hypothetical protein